MVAAETHPKRILVVDDEQNVRMTLAANLELAGYDVVEAADGADAVEKVAAARFDLVLMDIRMPRMNGVAALQEMRRHDPEVQIVLVTGFAVDRLIRDGIGGGAFTVVQKPVEPDALLGIVETAVKAPLVMVVDDKQAFTDGAVASLREAGVRAAGAVDGQAALDAQGEHDIDVWVLDLRMPGMSGVELTSKVLSTSSDRAVIAITGSDDADLIRDALAGGAATCLTKPFETQALLDAISAARGRRAARR